MAGERSDPKTLEFFHSHLDVPIIEQYWQTETGWPMTTQCLGMEQDHPSGTFPGIKYGSVSRPVPGYDMHVLMPDSGVDDEHHSHNHEAEEGSDQELVVKLPLPPGESLLPLQMYNHIHSFALAQEPSRLCTTTRKTSTPSIYADSLATTTLATRATSTKTAMSSYAPCSDIAFQLWMMAYLLFGFLGADHVKNRRHDQCFWPSHLHGID